MTKPHWYQIARLKMEGMPTQWDEVSDRLESVVGQPIKQQLPDPMFTLEELTEPVSLTGNKE